MHFSEDGFWLNQVWSSGESMAKVVNEKPATMDLFTTGQNWCFWCFWFWAISWFNIKHHNYYFDFIDADSGTIHQELETAVKALSSLFF